jgi:hypothetical protein
MQTGSWQRRLPDDLDIGGPDCLALFAQAGGKKWLGWLSTVRDPNHELAAVCVGGWWHFFRVDHSARRRITDSG